MSDDNLPPVDVTTMNLNARKHAVYSATPVELTYEPLLPGAPYAKVPFWRGVRNRIRNWTNDVRHAIGSAIDSYDYDDGDDW